MVSISPMSYFAFMIVGRLRRPELRSSLSDTVDTDIREIFLQLVVLENYLTFVFVHYNHLAQRNIH